MDRIEACKIFGISPNVKIPENIIKDKYRELQKKHHPDKNKNSKESEEITKKINEAYSELIKPNSTQQHTHNFHTGPRWNLNDIIREMNSRFNTGGNSFFHHHSQTQRHESFINSVKATKSSQDMSVKIDIPIEMLLNPKTYVAKIKVVKLNNCSVCNGIKVNLKGKKCDHCGGSGLLQFSNGPSNLRIFTCNHCGGLGVLYSTCNHCDSNGFISKEIDVELPLVSKYGKIYTSYTINGLGFPSKNISPETRGALNIAYGHKGNQIFDVAIDKNEAYLTNTQLIKINLSDLIKRKYIKIPVIDYKNKIIIEKKVKLPEKLSFGKDINEHMEFSFIVDKLGIKIGKKRTPYLVRAVLNRLVA